MATDVDEARDGGPARSWFDRAQVAGIASLGAGAIHLAAAGIHAEHPGLARIFVLLGALQVVAGLVLAIGGGRIAGAVVAAVNVGAVVGWVLTRTTGISWVDGLQASEAPQFADTVCAGLGAVAAALAAVVAVRGGRPAPRVAMVVPGALVATITVAAMLTGATHVHSHDEAAHAHGDETAADATATGGAAHVHEGDDATVAGGATHEHTGDETSTSEHLHSTDASTWPRPWDPTQPIDFSGVPDVTPEQQVRAESLVAGTLADLPQFADVTTIGALGFRSIGDAASGFEHYVNGAFIADDSFLDPNRPESLVYRVDGDQRTLVSAMFIAKDVAIDDPELVGWGGPLMQWHVHLNLCWKLDDTGKPVVAGVTDADGACAPGTVNAGGRNPMVHVWIAPHECGPFAALEGHGAGQTAGDGTRTDQCAHDHGTDPATGGSTPTAFDPAAPVDLSGVDGVTAEQQTFAEDLVTKTLTDLPAWSDPKAAEAAGFHSIGDAATGFEHYIQWDWIEDDVWLDPDHPESLVYAATPAGSRTLVSAMYMLPSTMTLADVPDWGGALMQWHVHDNLCYSDDPVAPQVRGLTTAGGTCRAPLVKHPETPMIHVWITPNECGPFAALEGVGAGSIAAGEQRWCDHVHGS